MPNGEEKYINKIRVERTDRNRRIYTKAKFKDVSTQTWADLSVRGSTYEIWHDDQDWDIRMQASCVKPEAQTIVLSNRNVSGKLLEQCKQTEEMKPTGNKHFG